MRNEMQQYGVATSSTIVAIFVSNLNVIGNYVSRHLVINKRVNKDNIF